MSYKAQKSQKERREWSKWKWLSYSSLSFPYLIGYFQRVSMNVVADDLMNDFMMTGALLGTLAATYFYIYTIMQIPSGILADYWGPKKTALTGIAVAGLGSIVFGLAQGVIFLFAGRILISVGVSVIFISILKIQTEWFTSREFGRISGLTILIGNAGAVLAATPLAFLVSLSDWRVAFISIGLLSLLSAILVFFCTKDSPRQVGLIHPDKQRAGNKLTLQADPPDQERSQPQQSIRFYIHSVLSNPWSWPLYLSFFGLYGAFFCYTGIWGVPYLMHVFHFSKDMAANVMLATALGVMVGSPLIGWISDRMGRRKPIFLFALFILLLSWTLLTFYSLWSWPSFWLFPLSFVIGLSISCFILSWAWSKEINHPDAAGIAMGTANMAGFLGAAILQPLLGFLLDWGWEGAMQDGARVYHASQYVLGFSICLFFLFLSFLSTLIMKESYNRNVYKP